MSKPDYTEWIPQIIITIRQELGLSQEDLARLAGFKSPTTISMFERGERLPTIDVLDKLFSAMGVTLVLGCAEFDTLMDSSKIWVSVRRSELNQMRKILDHYPCGDSGDQP